MIKGASHKEEQAQPRDSLKKFGTITGSWPVKTAYVKNPQLIIVKSPIIRAL